MQEDKQRVYLGCSNDLTKKNVTKIGMCTNTIDRFDTYNTSNPYYGFVPYIIIVSDCLTTAKNIEETLHSELLEYNLWYNNNREGDNGDNGDNGYNGGIDWYYKKFNKEQITNILDQYDYEYTILNDEELTKFIKDEKSICYKNKRDEDDKIGAFVGRKKKK